jgi:hypothetical protein
MFDVGRVEAGVHVGLSMTTPLRAFVDFMRAAA